MDYREALQRVAAADHAREQAELARVAVPRVEEKLQRLQDAVTATEQALAEARRVADEAEQAADQAAVMARSCLPAAGGIPSGLKGESVTVVAQSAGAAGGAHQEG